MKIILTAFLFVYFVSLSYLARRSKISFHFFAIFSASTADSIYKIENKIALRKYSSTVFDQLLNIKVKLNGVIRFLLTDYCLRHTEVKSLFSSTIPARTCCVYINFLFSLTPFYCVGIQEDVPKLNQGNLISLPDTTSHVSTRGCVCVHAWMRRISGSTFFSQISEV